MHPVSTNRRPLRGTLTLFVTVVAVAMFSSGWMLGKQQGARAAVPPGEGQVLNQGAVPASLAEDVDFGQFWDVWNLVKEQYYRRPVSDKALFYGAIEGMVAAAGDPYTSYFDPDAAAKFQEALSGTFSGIGAQIGVKDEQLVVIAPLPDSPAERAGLVPSSAILAIDGVDTDGMSVEEAVSRIRGEAGTEVVLYVSRDGLVTAEEVSITRGTIVVESVKWDVDANGIATISISEFNDDTSPLFNEAVNDILTKNAKGLILDLRSNPGGLLTSAIDVASAWVGYQPVVLEREQGNNHSFAGVSAPRLDGVPTVVLVDGGSASASEIVAGALQDYALATLVGTQTFGKGSVQDYRGLADGSAVKITIAEWQTPYGRTINETGLEPDAVVEYTKEDAAAGRDPQKETALEILAAQSSD